MKKLNKFLFVVTGLIECYLFFDLNYLLESFKF